MIRDPIFGELYIDETTCYFPIKNKVLIKFDVALVLLQGDCLQLLSSVDGFSEYNAYIKKLNKSINKEWYAMFPDETDFDSSYLNNSKDVKDAIHLYVSNEDDSAYTTPVEKTVVIQLDKIIMKSDAIKVYYKLLALV